MPHPLDPEPWYKENRDGKLEEYIAERVKHDTFGVFPLFKGYTWYEKLWDLGYLLPDRSYVRLMWNIGRGDEHFVVLSREEIKGLHDVPGHPGREGIHKVRKVLTNKSPVWEAQWLTPHWGMEAKSRI